MEPSEEKDLVLRSQSGDRGAFESLVRAQARLVWAHVYGLVRDASWTEDLVQETFLKAWESIPDLKDPGAFRGWLLTIARRLAWRHGTVSGRMETMEDLPEPAAPVDRSDPEEARDAVREAIQRLPERYRVPVTLHFLNGMEYAAISRSLNMADGSLRGLLARGIQKLRAELAPWWRKAHESA
jgi:RNA polymerase sigma-70 factor (ECF subfamily)